MSDEDTWIEPKPQPPPGAEPPEPPLPPLPPPPDPSAGRSRPGLLLGLGMGALILVLCAVAAFAVYRLVAGGSFGPGPSADDLQTQTAEALEPLPSATAPPTLPPQPTATSAPTTLPPTETTGPEDSPTPPPPPTASAPIFTAGQALFCRSGPSSVYPEVRTMNAGDATPILGQSVSPVDGFSIWWQVEVNDRLCFVSSDLGSVEGDLSGIPILAAPPTPTITPTPTVTPTATPTSTPTP